MNLRESLLTLGNTYMGLRGIEDECPEGSMPGLYIAGLFDKSESLVNEIVNFPNIITQYIMLEGEKISSENSSVIEYDRKLNMESGTVERSIVYKTSTGKIFKIESTRFLSFYDTNCGAISVTITPINFNGTIHICSEYDSTLLSRIGSYSYDEKVKHYYTVNISNQFDENFYTRLQLRDSGYYVDISAYVTVDNLEVKKKCRKVYGEKTVETLELDVKENETINFCKYFVVTDSRDISLHRLKEICLSKLDRMKFAGFNEELEKSAYILSRKWMNSNVIIEGDDESDLALRFNLFNLLVLGNENSSSFSIGAKGLSTEQYGGHYFWDTEAYLLQFYLNTSPAVAKNLLQFRYHTLERAKIHASEQGFEGCLWPWQSDSEGNECIRQTVFENGVIERRHILDQYHIVTDVAFACFKYLYRTGDKTYFDTILTQLIIEGMRFWKSFLLKTNNKDAQVYRIKDVMGPDEYHINVDDNYYTNYLTKLVFSSFFEYYENADDKQKYDITTINKLSNDEYEQLKKIGEKIYIPDTKNNILEQFEGYFKLRDLKITQFTEKGLPIYPDPNVGKGLPPTEHQDALQKDATTTQLIKQADAILSICQNPIGFSKEVILDNFIYYLDRTLQFSSLSPGIYSLAGALAKKTEAAYALFKLCINMDLQDIKNESSGGLHTACHGGAYQAVIEGFAGIRGEKDFLDVDPVMPACWKV